MKVTIIQTTTNTFDESYTLLTTRVTEAYLLTPDPGKVLKHKLTGQIKPTGLCVNKKYKIQEYEEIAEDEN